MLVSSSDLAEGKVSSAGFGRLVGMVPCCDRGVEL